MSRIAPLAVRVAMFAITLVVVAEVALALVGLAVRERIAAASTPCASAHAETTERRALDHAVAALLLSLATPIAIVAVLGHLGRLTPTHAWLTTGVVVVAGWVGAGRQGRRAALATVGRLGSSARGALFGGAWSPAAWTGIAAVAFAAWAAYLLPVWAWDALGYHLPLVHDALLTERLREVPTHIPYVNVYPHAADLYFVWFRLLLPDDTWIDFAQAPFALLAVAAGAGLAARAGASPARAIGLGLVFLAVPAVALQLSTNYVDVAYAALLVTAVHFLLSEPPCDTNDAFGAGALGLFLGTKPSAPLPFAVVLVALAIRRRAITAALGPCVVAVLIGGASYVINAARFGNPVWPVRLDLGITTLPGIEASRYFFDLGVEEPYRSYGWLRRFLASVYLLPARYVYDMRLGGFGPVVGWVLVPAAALVVALRRETVRRSFAIGALALASIATPAAFWTRYTLALATASLAFFAVGTETMRPAVRRALEITLGSVAALGLALALPGFTDGRMSLLELSRARDPAARFGGVDGDERAWIEARALVADGEAAAYDRSLGFPARLWDGRRPTRVVHLGADDDVTATLVRERVRVAVLDPRTAEEVIGQGLPLEQLFRCRVDPCAVYHVSRSPLEAPKLGRNGALPER
jgi:hypothetical protein